MKHEKILVIGLIMVLLSSLAVGLGSGSAKGNMIKINERGVKGYTQHGVIRINNDTNFATLAGSEGWQGDGSQSNPYVISGYDIDAHGAGDAIYIGNTTVYFVVENCYLHNASFQSWTYFDGDGIMLYNVTNGKITSNNITNNVGKDIYLHSSIDNNISGNNVNIIYLKSSSSNTIRRNNGSGIDLVFSSNNMIRENNITNNSQDGIDLSFSNNNTISSNNITNSGFEGINLGSSDGNIISKNHIMNNDYGIYLLSSKNNTISGNNITNNNEDGIFLDGSDSNTISGNNITNNNRYGICIGTDPSSNNTLYSNLISNNTDYGIYIGSTGSHNLIYHNFFYYNNGTGDAYDSLHVQACDNGTNNSWNTTTGIGNYWHDWANNNDTNDQNNDGIVDWPYKIDGSANAKDYYPLKNPTPPIPEFSTVLWILIIALIAMLGVARLK